MADTLTITDNRTGKQYEVPIKDGAINATDLRQDQDRTTTIAGLATYDPAFMNTASCRSRITYIDGDQGILEYRGYPIEQLAEKSTYLETAYLHPVRRAADRRAAAGVDARRSRSTRCCTRTSRSSWKGSSYDAHPMGVFLSTVGAFSTFYPDAKKIFDEESRKLQIHRLIAKVPTIAAYAYRHSIGRPYIYPDNDLSFTGNFLNMLFQMTELKTTRPTRCSSARSTCCSSCTPTTSRTAARARCAASAARTSIRTRRWPARPRRSTARCTAAPTKPCCAC